MDVFPLRDERENSFEVFGRIHAQRFVGGFHDAYAEAIFERTQLLEAFRSFEWAYWQRGVTQQEIAPVDVESNVLEPGLVDPAIVRYWAARKVNGISRKAGHHFDHVRIRDFTGCVDTALESRHDEARVIQKRLCGQVNGGGVNQRFVPLYVDHDGKVQGCGYLSRPVGSGKMAAAGHHHSGAEFTSRAEDAFVIGGHHQLRDSFRQRCFFPNVLQNGFTKQGDEGFARESTGCVTGWNDAKNSRGSAIERHIQG